MCVGGESSIERTLKLPLENCDDPNANIEVKIGIILMSPPPPPELPKQERKPTDDSRPDIIIALDKSLKYNKAQSQKNIFDL